MRAVWLTDIHLNFLDPPRLERFMKRLMAREPEAVLIAGDIGEADTVFYYLDLLHSSLAVPIYFVLGNHDYYNGSIADVRRQMGPFLESRERLIWLTDSEPISLTPATAILGHDGWADGALGDYWQSGVALNDFNLIAELTTSDRTRRLQTMRALAAPAAEHFTRFLPQALARHRKVIILTHVPPFRGAAWYMGKPSDANYLPFFASRCVGDALRSLMSTHSDKEALVLCGHTHGKGRYQPLPNLTVVTGDARYGQPKVQGELQIE